MKNKFQSFTLFRGGGGFGPKVWKFTLFLFFLNETFPKSLFPSNNGMEFYIQISFHLWLLGHSDLSISGKLLESICELSTVIVISFPKRYQCYLSPKSLVGGGWWDLPIIESISRSRPETWEWLWLSIDLLVIWSWHGHGLDLELDNKTVDWKMKMKLVQILSVM